MKKKGPASFFNPSGLAAAGLLAAAAVVFCLHLFVILNDPYVYSEDAAENCQVARNLAAGKGFVSYATTRHFMLYDGLERPEETFPLLQPFIVSLAFRVLGDKVWVSNLVNEMAFLLLVAAVYLITRRLFGHFRGLLAAALCLFAVDLNIYALEPRNDLIKVLLSLVSIEALSLWICREPARKRDGVLAGVLTGLAFLQKATGLLLLAAGGGLFVLRKGWEWMGGRASLKAAFVSALLCLAVFLSIASVYVARNMSAWGGPMPRYTGPISAMAIREFASGNRRTIDSDLSHLPYLDKAFIDWSEPTRYHSETARPADRLRYGINEMGILFLMIKRSYITPFVFLFLAGLSFFLISGRASVFLQLVLGYAVLSVLVISFTAHTEQRYYIFLIPLAAPFVSESLFRIGGMVAAASPGRLARVGYPAFVALLLAVMLALPWAGLMRRQVRGIPQGVARAAFYESLGRCTPENAVLLCNHACRVSFYAGRPAIELPDAGPEEQRRIARHYGVTHIVLMDKAAAEGSEFSSWGRRVPCAGPTVIEIDPAPARPEK